MQETTRLYIGNLPYHIEATNLKADFSEYGQIFQATVIKNKETQKSKGFGFITVAKEDTDKFLALSGAKYDERIIVINMAKERERVKIPRKQVEPETINDSSNKENIQKED